MTKKMFQVSRLMVIGIVIFVCCNLLMDQKVMMLDGDIISRCFMLVLAGVTFWIISVLYEKKKKGQFNRAKTKEESRRKIEEYWENEL